MKVLFSSIKKYVKDLDVTFEEFVKKITSFGLKIEGYKLFDKNLEKIVVGKILKIEKHPNADKLIICQVDVGDNVIQIVTGANNVKENDFVPVCLHNGKVVTSHGNVSENGIKIKKGKLRGIDSEGMMCSIDELGLDNTYPGSCDGIYIFKEEVKAGDDAIEVLGLHDILFDCEITPNRIDCYSVIGIAREVACVFDKEFIEPKIKYTGNNEDVNDYISVENNEKGYCKRYISRIVKNVKIKNSPIWFCKILSKYGIKPINNIVDITNYILLEYGQPMHAFDYSLIDNGIIKINFAKNGDKFKILDNNKEINLYEDTLTINDDKKCIAIAGIIGGENSKINKDTNTVVFEVACFDHLNIRKSSKKLGLKTDSSSIFEKKIDINNCLNAMNKACELIEIFKCGEVVGNFIDIFDDIETKKTINFDYKKINSILGIDIDKDIQLNYLKKLGFKYNSGELTIPLWRSDIKYDADLAEEVARFYGYDNIKSKPLYSCTLGKLSKKSKINTIIYNFIKDNGFSEIITYSFESLKVFDKLLIGKDSGYRNTINILNPLREDFTIMRTLPINGMLVSLSNNYNNGIKDAKLFEFGKVYIKDEDDELPLELNRLTLGMYNNGDFFDLKKTIENIFIELNLKSKLYYDNSEKKCFLHDFRQANITYKHKLVGYIGQIHPNVCKNYDIKSEVYIAVLNIEEIYDIVNFNYKFEKLNKYPSIYRDLSLLMHKDISVSVIEDIFDKNKNIVHYEIFDIYDKGDQIPQDYKSISYTLEFKSKEKTLTNEFVNICINDIISKLEDKNISLRK